MWALLLAIGALIASGTGRMVWIVVFAAIGLAQTGVLVLELGDDCAAVDGCVSGAVSRSSLSSMRIVRELAARAQSADADDLGGAPR